MPLPRSIHDGFDPDRQIARLRLRAFRFIAIDVETANGDPASICQIGLACVAATGEILNLGFWVKPAGAFEPFNTRLHGIDADTVRDAPGFPAVFAPLRPVLESCPLVQHSGFDRRAMNSACAATDLAPLGSTWCDSVTIARRAWPQLRGNGGHGLANLKEFLALDFRHHDAVEDARAAAQVVLRAEHETGLPFAHLAGGGAPRKPGTVAAPMTRPGNPDGPQFGQVACITGKLSVPRATLVSLAAQAGITVCAAVSDSVTLLVVSDRDLFGARSSGKSVKLRSAEALIARGHGIRIIGETDFMALIGG